MTIIEQIKALPQPQREAFIATLSAEEKAALMYCWELRARPEQLPPPGNWRHWLILSGRGFGKTRTGAEWVINRARQVTGDGILIVGQTETEVREIMIDQNESSLFKVSPPWFMPRWKEGSGKRSIIWPNGAVAKVIYGDRTGQGRGPNVHTIWLDEFAKFQYPEELWKESLNLSLRKPAPFPCQALFTTTPRPIKILKELVAHPRTVVVAGSTYDNLENLDDEFKAEIIQTYEGTRLGRQEIYGEILDDHPGALWQYSILDEHRITANKLPELSAIAIGVDPSVSDKDGSDECGIVAAGRCTEDYMEKTHYVTFEDRSGRYHVREWTRQVVALYHKLDSEHACSVTVVAEVNQGGDMVKSSIHRIDPSIRVITNAELNDGKYWNKSKEARAEPVAMLSEQGVDHHHMTLPQLEDELCTWEPGKQMPSPNRLDAKVWAYLFLIQHSPIWGVFV